MANDLIPDNPDPFMRGLAVASRKWENEYKARCEEIWALRQAIRENEAKAEAYDGLHAEAKVWWETAQSYRTLSRILLERIGLGFFWWERDDDLGLWDRMRLAIRILPERERWPDLDLLLEEKRTEEDVDGQ